MARSFTKKISEKAEYRFPQTEHLTMLAMLLIILLRMPAKKYRRSLPKIHLSDEPKLLSPVRNESTKTDEWAEQQAS